METISYETRMLCYVEALERRVDELLDEKARLAEKVHDLTLEIETLVLKKQ